MPNIDIREYNYFSGSRSTSVTRYSDGMVKELIPSESSFYIMDKNEDYSIGQKISKNGEDVGGSLVDNIFPNLTGNDLFCLRDLLSKFIDDQQIVRSDINDLTGKIEQLNLENVNA